MAGYLKNSVLIFDWVRLNTDTRHQLKIRKCVRYLLSSRKPKKKKNTLKGAMKYNQARNTKITNNYKAITLIFNCLLTNFQNIAGEKTLLQRDSITKFYLAVSAIIIIINTIITCRHVVAVYFVESVTARQRDIWKKIQTMKTCHKQGVSGQEVGTWRPPAGRAPHVSPHLSALRGAPCTATAYNRDGRTGGQHSHTHTLLFLLPRL